jgi:hypothetical protein
MTDSKTSRQFSAFGDPLVCRIVDFVREIGIEVRAGEVVESTPCPGILLARGALVVEEARLSFPGDLLHEAGHLAVMAPDRRRAMHRDAGADPAEEMMAIAWSYAAALHLGIDPAIVFHAGGYRGESTALLENFGQGRYLALPTLQWLGMAYDKRRAAEAGVDPFPAMRRWLREAA